MRLSQFPSKVKVGTYNEDQLRHQEDKEAVELAKQKTGYNYVIANTIRRKGESFMEIYLVSNEDYYNSSTI
jgi:hypothetical protein